MTDKSEDQQSLSTANPMVSTSLITYGMVHKLECVQRRQVSLPTPIELERKESDTSIGAGEPKDTAKQQAEVKYKWDEPTLMIVCEDGDLNSALHHLRNSLHDPFAKKAVATVLIQESVREAFLARLVDSLEPLDPQIYQHPNYVRSLAKLQQLKAETIVGIPKLVPAHATPVLVSDLSHNFLGEGPTGVITMHTFRTPRDSTQVNNKETLEYGSVSIWNEKLAGAYEICALLKNEIFMINCFNVDLAPILAKGDPTLNDVRIEKGYHYERITINHKRKIIVFAVGTIFAN